ncbi:MAG: hypothetical protein BGO47_14285 [Microbacterium sp. 67-17]|uniref:XRE family transcriptional regulator n=1 Tax=Microbacterium sp. 67-17 TaxID=1895782 RepID=UPI00095D80FB|nr:XRE family transcriptional regulator [Microbacterium sp. 67-17]OJV98932.1 MAG: hypothetical protein BGO47_14285 [Microbacterium sp. 67-17]
MSTLGDAITTLRQSRGLSQTELADKIGATQVTLHRYEAGEREPRPEVVTELAAALGVTEQFLQHEFRLQGGVAQDAHMRKRKTTKAGDWKLVEARLNELRMSTTYFLARAPMRQEFTVPEVDMTVTSPEEAAQLTRARWRMPSGPVASITPWLEAAGIVVIVEDFPTPKIDGMSQWGKESAVMLVNGLLPLHRRRLTMTHELGHLVMHDEVLAGDDDVESEANAFAAEFLMPGHIIRNELRPLSGASAQRTISLLLTLKERWGTSMQALYERAFSLGVVDAARRQDFYKMMSARRWRTREPGDETFIPETPRLAPSIGGSLRANGLGDLQVAEMLGFTSTERISPFLPTPELRSHLRALG